MVAEVELLDVAGAGAAGGGELGAAKSPQHSNGGQSIGD